ncbi:hypothetical protein KCP76_17715 [Salmonella enterica subsp. enterica serovar Weltevreden]|nr:hypothetical protein KCP76_17715 [Salmonella enterica subsp. enterica serovar Weltevreden]
MSGALSAHNAGLAWHCRSRRLTPRAQWKKTRSSPRFTSVLRAGPDERVTARFPAVDGTSRLSASGDERPVAATITCTDYWRTAATLDGGPGSVWLKMSSSGGNFAVI